MALEHIYIYLIKEARNLLLGSKSNVAGIACNLDFESSSYFTRLFKKVVGVMPVQCKKEAVK
jgi:AraC-like DNA-binding protein